MSYEQTDLVSRYQIQALRFNVDVTAFDDGFFQLN